MGRRRRAGPRRLKPRRALEAWRWVGRRRWWQKLLLLLATIFIALPLTLVLVYRVVPVPGTALMLVRLFEGEGWQRDWVPLDEVAPAVARSVVAGEDNLFCTHDGFDWASLREAWMEWQAGEGMRGASTISMQVAKNVFLWDGRTILRKALEAYLTVMIEALWPKRRIVEVYLNVAEWAPGVYGVEAAARHHFGKSAADLSPREAALLAAVLPNPRQWSAGQPSGRITARAATIARRVGQLGRLLDCLP